MKKIILSVFLLSLIVLIPAVGAQTVLRFDSVQIQFWPEYDQPTMLVIYTLELPPEQSLPVDVSVRIPARAGSPIAVAVLESAQLVTRDYSLTADGDWNVVTLTTDSPTIHLEYYDPALSQIDQPRDFSFEWSFDYLVDQLVVAFKQPAGASEVVFSVDLGAPEIGADGLNFYSASFGELPAGEIFLFSIRYQKSDDQLSVQPMVQAPPQTDVQPVKMAAQYQVPTWGWYVIGAGAVILAGGGMYLWYINTPTSFSKYRQKKARSSSFPSGGGSGVFCHECGAKSNHKDKFCRECGTQLRT